MLRRDIPAILALHVMNPHLREVYVEGLKDRMVLEWLAGDARIEGSYVFEIDHVNVPGVDVGGNRARVIEFARAVEGEDANILCLVDRDVSVPDPRPGNLRLTDGRDLESYLLDARHLSKVLRVGCGVSHVDPESLLRSVVEAARQLAALQVVSDARSLALPFNRSNLQRAITSDGVSVHLDLRKYVQTLLQNASLSLRLIGEVVHATGEEVERGRNRDYREVVRGKDSMELVSVSLQEHGVHRDDVHRLMWASLDRAVIDEYSALRAIVDFLTEG